MAKFTFQNSPVPGGEVMRNGKPWLTLSETDLRPQEGERWDVKISGKTMTPISNESRRNTNVKENIMSVLGSKIFSQPVSEVDWMQAKRTKGAWRDAFLGGYKKRDDDMQFIKRIPPKLSNGVLSKNYPDNPGDEGWNVPVPEIKKLYISGNIEEVPLHHVACTLHGEVVKTVVAPQYIVHPHWGDVAIEKLVKLMEAVRLHHIPAWTASIIQADRVIFPCIISDRLLEELKENQDDFS